MTIDKDNFKTVHQIPIQETVLFSTQIYTGHLNYINNDILKSQIYNLKEKSQGRKLSNCGGWQSNDLNLELFHSFEFHNLLSEATNVAGKISELWELDKPLELGNFWCNINGFKDYNNIHSHPGSAFSMVYYVDCYKDSGNIVFCRPDLQEHYFSVQKLNNYTFKSHYFVPEPSKFLLFPSYIDHFVTANISIQDRISVSINFK